MYTNKSKTRAYIGLEFSCCCQWFHQFRIWIIWKRTIDQFIAKFSYRTITYWIPLRANLASVISSFATDAHTFQKIVEIDTRVAAQDRGSKLESFVMQWFGETVVYLSHLTKEMDKDRHVQGKECYFGCCSYFRTLSMTSFKPSRISSYKDNSFFSFFFFFFFFSLSLSLFLSCFLLS